MDSQSPQGRAGGGAPVAGWASGPLGAVQAADREIARQTALRARAVAEFAASRPASADRQPGEPGAMSAERRAARPAVLAEVSEWAVPELSIALAVSKQAAGQLLERSLTLVHQLPGTLAALESGLLHPGHLWTLLERVGVIVDDEKRAELERDVLAWIAGRAEKRQVTTPAQLGDKVRRMGLGRDLKQEADELLAALRARGVWVRPDRRAGMAVLELLLTAPEAQAVVDALGRYVDALEETADPADTRTRGQKMVDVLLDLVLRPGASQLPPVQAQLTLVAGVRTLLGGGAPGEIGGEPVPAEMIRALARALGLLSLPDPAPAPTGPAGTRGARGPDAERHLDRQREPLPAGWDPSSHPDETWPEWLAADFDRWEAELDARALAGVWGGEDDPPPDVQQRWWEQEARWLAEENACHDDGRGQPRQALTDHHDGGITPAPAPVPEDACGDAGAGVPDRSLPATTSPTPAAAAAATATAPSSTAAAGTAGSTAAAATAGSAAAASSMGAAPTDAVAPSGASRWPAAHAAVEQAGLALLSLDRALRCASAAVGRGWLDQRDDERAARSGGGHRIDTAGSDLAALHTASAERRADLAALLDRTAGGTLADRPRIAVVDELTGALLALTDARELRRLAHCGAPDCARRPARCDHDLTGRPGLGPPPATDGYRPGAALDRWVRARDARCRFPGCRRRVPAGGELDHHTPWPQGATSADNLTGFCTGDHRGKHQAPGWTYDLDATGTLSVTTPSGLTATTDPPPY